MSIYVPGYGPMHSRIMVIGEAPGAEEEEKLQPFVGPVGRYTESLCKEAGFSLQECYRTNVFKYRPPNNDIKRAAETGHTIEEGLEQLWGEVYACKPNVILVLGSTALRYVCGKDGISKWRGSIIPSQQGGYKCVPTYHPGSIITPRRGEAPDQTAAVLIGLDIKRAFEQSFFPEIKNPHRLLQIAKSDLDVYNFLDGNRSNRIVSVDIETIKSVPICIGLAFKSTHAISIPLFPIHGIEGIEIPDSQLQEIWRLLGDFFAEEEIKLVGHNFKFDEAKLIAPIGFLEPGNRKLYVDTMLLGHTLYCELPKSLAFYTSIYTREPFYKDEGRLFNPRKDPVSQYLKYNAKDAAVTFEIMEQMLPELEECGLKDFFFKTVMPLHWFYMEMENEGLKVDMNLRAALQQKYRAIDERGDAELATIIGRDVWKWKNKKRREKSYLVNSPKEVGKLLFEELKVPRRADVGEDALVAALANSKMTDTARKAIELILSQRRVKKTISTYLGAEPDYDGRMRTSYKITGTETGRTSSTVLKAPVRPTQVGLAFQTLTKHGDIGSELQSIFIADEGYIFLECDQSQAEARVVAHLANDNELLSLFDSVDIHRFTACLCIRQMFPQNITGDVLKTVKDDERFLGKTLRHAGNYGMGKRRLMTEIMTGARRAKISVTVSEWKAGQILERFHKFTPRIKSVFHADVIKALHANDQVLNNPFGRRREFFGRMDESTYNEVFAQIPQSTVGDWTKIVGLRIKEREKSIRVVMEAHDALKFLIPIDKLEYYARIIQEEFTRPIDFSLCSVPRGTLIIPCEMKVGKRLCDKKQHEEGMVRYELR
jgi:DNA polymerase-1